MNHIMLVSEISRLARSTLQVLEIMQAASDRGLSIHIIKSSLVIDGGKMGKVLATILGVFSELERDLISERTTEALKRRKELGLPMGRPQGAAKSTKLDKEKTEILKYMELGVSKAAICKIIKCQPATLYAWLKRTQGWVPRN